MMHEKSRQIHVWVRYGTIIIMIIHERFTIGRGSSAAFVPNNRVNKADHIYFGQQSNKPNAFLSNAKIFRWHRSKCRGYILKLYII